MRLYPTGPRPRRPLAVTFDFTGTLAGCPRLGEMYAEVLARHGIEVEAAQIRRLFPLVWQELDCLAERGRDRFTSHPDGPRGWWRRLLERLCEHLEAPPPSPFAAAELYNAFAEAEAWQLYPEVPEVVAALGRHRLELAVVSNHDERLPRVVEALGLAPAFAAVVTSSEVGTEKPDPAIFHHALDRLGVAPDRALHVGDSLRRDVEGALAAGMSALYLDRGGGRGDLADLTALPQRLLA